MTPTEAYYRTKKALLLFVGALLLAIFAGFKIANDDQRITILPFQLERPELLATILFVVVIFYLFQFSLQWAAQQTEVQISKFHRLDFISTSTIGSASILCYVGSLALPFFKSLNIPSALPDFFSNQILIVIVTFIAFFISTVGSRLLERTSIGFGKWIRSQLASREKYILKLLDSKDWILNFNPEHPHAEKPISFEPDGSIGKGKNKNETTWRVRNGLLEILNSEGELYSRFLYNSHTRTFEHTNDPDTLSIKSQIIFPTK